MSLVIYERFVTIHKVLFRKIKIKYKHLEHENEPFFNTMEFSLNSLMFERQREENYSIKSE